MAISTIEESYVRQFHANVHMMCEQQFSLLDPTIVSEPARGDSTAFDRIGPFSPDGKTYSKWSEPGEISQRFQRTPLNYVEHSRRWAYPKLWHDAVPIDKADKIKMLQDPEAPYVVKMSGAMGRAKDSQIIEALDGNAYQGDEAPQPVALPAKQKINEGGGASPNGWAQSVLNLDVVRQAKKRLDQEQCLGWQRFMLVDAQQMQNMLAMEEVTSSDYNIVKALVQGSIEGMTYMGFTWIQSELLPKKTGGTGDAQPDTTYCFAYAQPAIRRGVWTPMQTIAGPRADLSYTWQIYQWMVSGCVRMEDEMVVRIAAKEMDYVRPAS